MPVPIQDPAFISFSAHGTPTNSADCTAKTCQTIRAPEASRNVGLPAQFDGKFDARLMVHTSLLCHPALLQRDMIVVNFCRAPRSRQTCQVFHEANGAPPSLLKEQQKEPQQRWLEKLVDLFMLNWCQSETSWSFLFSSLVFQTLHAKSQWISGVPSSSTGDPETWILFSSQVRQPTWCSSLKLAKPLSQCTWAKTLWFLMLS